MSNIKETKTGYSSNVNACKHKGGSKHDYTYAVDWNEQQAKNFADMLHNITQIGGEDE